MPNVEVEVKVKSAIEDKDRIFGDKTEKMLFLQGGKQVATIDVKYTLQPLAEKYLDLSVAPTEIDFGMFQLIRKLQNILSLMIMVM